MSDDLMRSYRELEATQKEIIRLQKQGLSSNDSSIIEPKQPIHRPGSQDKYGTLKTQEKLSDYYAQLPEKYKHMRTTAPHDRKHHGRLGGLAIVGNWRELLVAETDEEQIRIGHLIAWIQTVHHFSGTEIDMANKGLLWFRDWYAKVAGVEQATRIATAIKREYVIFGKGAQ